MANPPLSRAECEWAIELLKEHNGNITSAAREARFPESSYRHRLEVAERVYGIEIPQRPPRPLTARVPKGRRVIEVIDGIIYAGSDAHYWPGEPSTAHRAFCKFIERDRKQLRAVVLDGDAYDLAGISRHQRIGWTGIPSVAEEMEVVTDRLTEIEKASGKVERYWPFGNHDGRFETYLANTAPEIKGVPGMSLVDHHPNWIPCWSLFVNDRPGGLVLKHRIRGGIHATHNNTLNAGRSTGTGHLHSQKVTPYTDYNGTRWGVDLGCLADIYDSQFQDYLEDNPRNWRAGFARFRFVEGRLLTPELIRVVEDGVVEFRGELINV